MFREKNLQNLDMISIKEQILNNITVQSTFCTYRH